MSELRQFECPYGYFTADGREYVITRPDTPRPWINIISNGSYGITIGQTGTGFSWLDNPNLNRVTRFTQDMVEDAMGKFLYVRDEADGDYWSAGWKPTCADFDFYECRHGIGYSTITTCRRGIETVLTQTVAPADPIELWSLTITNRGLGTRKLNIFSYLEWNLGVAPFENREFQKIFIDTAYNSDLNALLATKRLWEIPNGKGENLNSDWDYVAFHACSEIPVSFDGDRESFIGMYGSKAAPRAMRTESLEQNTGKWGDGIGALQVEISLEPGESKEVVFTLGLGCDREQVARLIRKYSSPEAARRTLAQVAEFWRPYLDECVIDTPDAAMNVLTNTWLKYQTISCRLWSRTAYYQSGGAYGFRDQLQDSQLFLSFNPDLTREQILLHARHQYRDGTVKHWWHPITEDGPDSRFSDDLLWLPFVTMNYIRETQDYDILSEVEPYLGGGEGTLYDHCRRAIDRAFHRFSARGIPLIGEGDWNDGLSACGTDWQGESFWMAEFLYVVINEFLAACSAVDDLEFRERCVTVAGYLKENLNRHGWDGEWYLQATTDKGAPIGSRECAEGAIFLNPQTWAILSGMVPQDRLDTVVRSIENHLLKEFGPVLLAPAYSVPDGDIGYLTRYAPGLRENGGVYTHAATWTIMTFCQLKRADVAYDIYRKICCLNRSGDVDGYKAEPYVLPGNTDGPDSPNYGRGGWTWYTGAAAWLYRVTHEHILGIRPTSDGLLIDPCIPKAWPGFRVRRPFRGCIYEIEVSNPDRVSHGVAEIHVDGIRISGNVIPSFGSGVHRVHVLMGQDNGAVKSPDTRGLVEAK